MTNSDWKTLADTIKDCRNSGGTLHYNYDNALGRMIDHCSPLNTFPNREDPCYRVNDANETLAAIDNWIKIQKHREDTSIVTNAQLLLNADDQNAKKNILSDMYENKCLLVRPVYNLFWSQPFPSKNRLEMTKVLFTMACAAIDEFQKNPTALILFPDPIINNIKVFGGFYGSPWSYYNNRSLRLKFRTINPHFQIHVCTVWESERFPGWSDQRKVGVMFTYTDP